MSDVLTVPRVGVPVKSPELLRKWHFDRAGVKGITPGDDTHKRLMTASKISAAFIPSRSPYESYYSLWHKMAGTIDPLPPNEEVLERGHMLEPAVAWWFAARHRELNVRNPKNKVWFYDRERGYGATPDRYLEQGGYVVGLLEIKTSTSPDGWGEPGTDQIPAHYYDQVQWQMLCTGVPVTYVARLGSRFTYDEYKVEANRAWQNTMLKAANRLTESIKTDSKPSLEDVEHTATYEAVRELHPEIDGSTVEVPAEMVRAYYEAVEAKKAAEIAERAAKTRILDVMGYAKTGTVEGEKFVTRTARNGGTPYLQAVRGKTAADLPETQETSTFAVRNDLRKAA